MWTCSRTPVQDRGGERAASFLDNVAACNGGTSYSSLLRSSDGEALIIRDSTTVLEKRCCVIYAIKTTRYLLQSLSLSSLLSFFFSFSFERFRFSLDRSTRFVTYYNLYERWREKKTTARFFPLLSGKSRSGRSDTKWREVSRAEVRVAKRTSLKEGRKVDLRWYEKQREREREVWFLPSFQSAHFCKTDRESKDPPPFVSPRVKTSSSTRPHVSRSFAPFPPSQTSLLRRPRSPSPNSKRRPTLAFKWRGEEEGARFRNCTRGRVDTCRGFYSRRVGT